MLRVTIILFLVCSHLFALELPPGFVAETLATNLNAVTAIAPAPDGRIFIAEQTGHLLIWKQGALLEQPALSLHVTDFWERGLIGVTLHPDFPRTPQLYLLYVTDRPFVHHVLSRFTLNGDAADPKSEQVLFEGDDQAKLGGAIPAGHQGGSIRFGPDGKLYVGLGDQTAGEPAQRLNTFQGKILRINPDGLIPETNPFFSQAEDNYRAIFAYGVRNPFGLATQPETKRMFFTDVGGSAFEEVNELIAGANYGWPRAEGLSTNPMFKQPLHAYSPLVGQSIVGGVFLPRSSAWPQKWRGKFLFGDFMKHWIKALDPDSPTNVVSFARGLNGPVAIELASDGSLFVLNRGAVWRDPKKFVANAGSLLRIRHLGEHRVAQSSVSTASTNNTAALGLPMDPDRLPRRITRDDWIQRLRLARRWPIWMHSHPWHYLVRETPPALYLPDGAQVKLASISEDVSLPPGAVVLRNFHVNRARTNGSVKPDAPPPIETRLFVVGTPYSYGASYRWLNENEAELIEDGQLVSFFEIPDDDDGRQLLKTLRVDWWFPGTDDAISFPITNPSYWISTAPSDFVVVPRPSRPNLPINRLANMMFKGALATDLSLNVISNIPPGAMWQSLRLPLETRVRFYLHGNCGVCHQPGGASRALFDARITAPLSKAQIINGPLAAGDLGIPGAKIVVPGQPDKSILYRRMKTTDFFRMPPVQYHNQPSPILPVLEQWILSLATNTPTR